MNRLFRLARPLGVVAVLACALAGKPASAQESNILDAASDGDLPRVKELIDAKVDVNTKADNGATPLIMASEQGHLEVVKLLLNSTADVNAMAKDLWNQTALMFASQNGHADVVRELIAAKADVNAKDSQFLSTALMKASEKGHLEVVRALIEGKADLNASSMWMETALSLAKTGGHQAVVQLLKSSGATD